ncbi:MAG: glutathione S-transferase family protein [Betaproteobacteria bacterium]|jgi:glutathione S-transferase|nr:MAG: glutathione S-transferase family protein [Betaproteobacteria bacterium]
MLKIYHAPRTRGFRIVWLCEELGTPYQIVPVDMSPKYRASPEWRSLNPVGKVPVMSDGDMTIFESGAMLQYVLDKYGEGRLQPQPGTNEHGIYLQWLWFAEATFSRPLGEIVNHNREFADNPLKPVIDEMKTRARLCAQALDAALAEKSWIIGETFSAADIMLGLSLRSYQRLMNEDFPGNVAPYWTRLTARPAYQRAIAAETRPAS